MTYIRSKRTQNQNEAGSSELLAIRGLITVFKNKSGNVHRAIDNIDLSIKVGEIHGLVGESGCGKTVTALSILRLINRPGRISGGKLYWKNQNILNMSHRALRKVRGNEIAMIFQNPQASLHPLYTIGDQMRSVIKLHLSVHKKDAYKKSIEILNAVNLRDPEKIMSKYPDQLSGGMCQRVMIAMALSCEPELLIADEPTASLDVTIQAQILELLLDLKEKHNTSILFISHDLGAVAQVCDHVSVMYLGRIVESSTAIQLYARPRHPYTKRLLYAVPLPDPTVKQKMKIIEGDIPDLSTLSSNGCQFWDRCPKRMEKCFSEEPELKEIDSYGTRVACWLY